MLSSTGVPPLGTSYYTGQNNPVSGVFEFAGYVDRSTYPSPSLEQRFIPLSKGEVFPPCCAKFAYWTLRIYA